MPSPPTSPDHDDDQEFSCYFEELLDIPWDEDLAMDKELELEHPLWAPHAQAYCIEEWDQDQEQPNETCPETPSVSHTKALESNEHLKIQFEWYQTVWTAGTGYEPYTKQKDLNWIE